MVFITDSYVGISGFVSRTEVEAVLTDEVRAELHRTHYKLAVGVLASHKTLRGERPSGKWKWRYPKAEDIAGIFPHDRDTLNVIHFNTKEPDLPGQIEQIATHGGLALDGFQLNVIWPQVEDIRRISRAHVGKRIIMQISKKMLDEVGNDPVALYRRLMIDGGREACYVTHGVTDFLLDPSGGDGTTLDSARTRTIAERLHEDLDADGYHSLRVGIAGGLEAKTVSRLRPLYRNGVRVSTDSESRLRTVVDETSGEDRIDTEKARQYVLSVLRLIR